MFAQIANFNKNQLNKTTTQVTQHPCVRSTGKTNYSKQHERDMTEYWDKPSTFRHNIKKLAALIKESKNLVVYTGAGISTSASIPDYRGENGFWTLTDRGEKAPPCMDLAQALPTVGHMAIQSLVENGICKQVISTNIDGLHRRSGVPADKIAELHGNCFKEQCKTCDREFLHNFNVTTNSSNTHETGRTCTMCGEALYDTIINFQESLPQETYQTAERYSKEADVSLVLGTSMLVAPANLLPVKNPTSKLVIINRQKTPFDSKCELRIFADTDDALQILMEELAMDYAKEVDGFMIPIPPMEHDAKFEKFKPKLDEINKKKAQSLTRKGQNYFVENVQGEKRTVSGDVVSKGSLVFLEKCFDMECVIDCVPAKIIMHELKNCKVIVRNDILTSCLEMIHCENVTLESHSCIRTLSIDQSQSCILKFHSTRLMGSIYSCGVTNLMINPSFGTKPDALMPVTFESSKNSDDSEQEEQSIKQYISRLYGHSLLTEEVIREGVGYATTVREKTQADEKEEKLLAALEKIILKDIHK